MGLEQRKSTDLAILLDSKQKEDCSFYAEELGNDSAYYFDELMMG